MLATAAGRGSGLEEITTHFFSAIFIVICDPNYFHQHERSLLFHLKGENLEYARDRSEIELQIPNRTDKVRICDSNKMFFNFSIQDYCAWREPAVELKKQRRKQEFQRKSESISVGWLARGEGAR